MNSTNKPVQTRGDLLMWRNPENSYRHYFLELDLKCELDDCPGILIISDATHSNVSVFNIERLWNELPKLIKNKKDKVVAYWWRVDDTDERSRMLSNLTARPVFLG